MKILFITRPCFADNSFSLIHAFQREGHDITCLLDLNTLNSTIINIKKRITKNSIIPASDYLELKLFNGYIDFTKCYIANFNIINRFSPIILLKTYKIYQFIKKGHYDIIHIDHKLERSDQYLYRIFGHKMVLTRHDPFAHSGMTFSKKTNIQLANAYKYIPKVILHNNEQKNQFCMLNDISENRVLVNNMCPYDCMELFTKGKPTRDKNTILFFGRISKYKGLEYLCEAMVQVHNVLPNAKLIIVGGGSLYFDYTPYKDLDYIELNNNFVDADRLVELLQKCSFVVCPYTDATQSGVILTCNALGVPVIATRVGGLPQMIDDNRSGLLVEPKNTVALSEAIIYLLSDEGKLNEMYKYVSIMYSCGSRSSKEIISKYIDFYKKALRVVQ